MKQSTLTFSPFKRVASSGNSPAGKARSKPSVKRSLSLVEPSEPEVIHITDSSDGEAAIGERNVPGRLDDPVSATRSARSRKVAVEDEPTPKKRRVGVFDSREGAENTGSPKVNATPKKTKETVAKSDGAEARWRNHYGSVREKMGNLEPVHSEGQTMVDHILRVFDLSYEYGPCVGVTRLERWERADALGLKPPFEVREILLTKTLREDTRFTESVFYGEV